MADTEIDTAVDPFARRNPTSESIVSISALAALLWGVGYVSWRAVFTLDGTDSPAAVLLLAAEVLAVVVFAARVRASRATPIVPLAVAGVPLPDTTAVVNASGSSIDELRTTLVSLGRVEGVDHVIVVDSDGSRWLRSIAERFDASICEPGTSVADAARSAPTDWVLFLDGGDLPMPDLVSMCATRCSSPDVAVVQVGIEEADPTSFEHDPDGRWSLEPFEQQVVRPSLAARGSIPWSGDGPAMVRRAVLSQIDEFDLATDTRRAGLTIIRAGMQVTHLPMTLARVRGPQGLGDSLGRRHERLVSAVSALGSTDLRGVPGATRSAHLLALTPTLAALQRLLLVAAAVVVLGFAQIPIQASAIDLLVIGVPSYLLRWNAHLLLGRGRLGPFSVLRSDIRSLGVDLMPFGRIRPDTNRAGLGLVVVLVVALDVGVVVTALSVWRNWADRLPAEYAAVALGLTAAFLGVAMEVLLDAMARRQRRNNHRVRLGLVTCRIEEHEGQLVDLSTGGAGVLVACEPHETLDVGDVSTVSFRIPDADGAWKNVSALVHVAHSSSDPEGGTRLGLAFDDPTDAPLDPVVEFLTIDRRLVALGRRELIES